MTLRVLVFAHQESETWVTAGFSDGHETDRDILRGVKAEHGFDLPALGAMGPRRMGPKAARVPAGRGWLAIRSSEKHRPTATPVCFTNQTIGSTRNFDRSPRGAIIACGTSAVKFLTGSRCKRSRSW